jgi:hypothetical protein
MIKPTGAKRWLVVWAVVLLTPVLLAARPDKKKGCEASSFADKKCQQAAEGGTSTGYLLAVGATCLGAVFVRTRFSGSSVS